MKEFILTLILFLSVPPSLNDLNLEGRVDVLEKQVENLEDIVADILENQLVEHYGVERMCRRPRVQHGSVHCDREKIVAGTRCSARCQAGFMANTQGVECQQGGKAWSGQLRCEIPLLVVSGGSINTSVEVINFHNGTGCDLKIPDIRETLVPVTKQKEVRLMHNMFYFPGTPFQLLVCNGLSKVSKASCHSWSLGENRWKHHSYPNMDVNQTDNDLQAYEQSYRRKAFDHEVYKLGRSGRYAAESFSSDGSHYIVGGVLNDGKSHKITGGIREYMGQGYFEPYGSSYREKLFWKKADNSHVKGALGTKRALFCIAQYNTSNFAAIGGLSERVLNSVEMVAGDGDMYVYDLEDIPGMNTARNGHGCVGIQDGSSKILVSGGSDSPHSGGGQALGTSEMYSAGANQWEEVGNMTVKRFGHKLVNVGGRIIAVGGKEWNPDILLKSAEEFDVYTKSWRNIGDVLAVPRAHFAYTLIPHSVIPGCTIN